jgi:hypothetical protein
MRTGNSSPRRGIHLPAGAVALGAAHFECFFERRGGFRDGILWLPFVDFAEGIPVGLLDHLPTLAVNEPKCALTDLDVQGLRFENHDRRLVDPEPEPVLR